eukprot:symbB.v1.2.039208.t1/scaffold6410.1/size18337/1
MHCSQGLIARGRVHGTVELCDCITVTSETLEHSFDKHQVSDLSIIKYATVYAWVFTNATAFNEPVRHLPKQSCRIWMQIEYPKNATRIRKCIQEAQTVDVTDMDQINDIATKAGLTNFPKYKTPYFRAMDKEADYHEKFFYVLENAASVKASLMRALTFCLTVNELQDSADCMQMAEVKAAIKETGATAKRSVADARKQWMGIALTQELKKIRNNKAVQEIVEVPAAEEGVAADAEGASTAGSGLLLPTEGSELAEDDILGTWVAHGGKQDRCQLGSCEQMDRPKQVVQHIEEAVRESVEPCLGRECIEDSGGLSQAIEVCSHFLREGGPPDLKPDTQAALFQLGQSSVHFAHVMRSCGYNAVKKFPAEFDTVHATRTAVLLFTDFLPQAEAACRRQSGFEASVLAANADKWRDITLSHMTMFHGVPMLEELVRLPGVMDAMGRITELKAELAHLKVEAERKPRSLACGRQLATSHAKKVNGLKRALSQMSSSGDSIAEAALEKVKDDRRQPDGSKSRKTARRQKKRRGARKQRPYKRVEGDELRLIRKREMVRWGLKHEGLIQGSIDAALRQEFPGEYRSRRYSHWKAQYKKFCWEDVPDRAKSVRHVASRFKKKHAYSKQSVNTAGNYLTFDDPVMEESRQRFKDLIRKHDVPWELICNYDQTWVNPWRSPKSMLKRKRTKRPSRNQTRMTSIVGARAGVSICTSSFCNGDRGPLFISVTSNCLDNKWIAEMNEKSDGDYFIYKNTTGGHFMHSESTVVMYQSLLKRIYDMRRARYGLHHRVGLL